MRVVFDIDDVIRPWVESVLRVYAQENPDLRTPAYEDITSWTMPDHFPDNDKCDIYDFAFNQQPYEIYSNADVRPGTTALIEKLKQQGHTIVLASNNNGERALATVEWLAKHKILFDELLFTPLKSDAKGDIYFDDSIKNLEEVVSSLPDAAVYAYNTPWNQEWDGDRVRSMVEVEEAINNVDKR